MDYFIVLVGSVLWWSNYSSPINQMREAYQQTSIEQNELIGRKSSCLDTIKVINFRTWRNGEWIRYSGKVSHSCNKAVGIEFSVVGEAADGTVIFSERSWFNSVSNYLPNKEYAFDGLNKDKAKDIESIIITPTDLRIW